MRQFILNDVLTILKHLWKVDYLVFESYAEGCQWTAFIRFNEMKYDHCVACGSTENLNHHHLFPRSLGGDDDDCNLITLCGDCHSKVHEVKANWKHSELTKKAMKEKKLRNEYTGTVPYGFRCEDGVNLVKDDIEQEIIEFVVEKNKNGLSLRNIANRLGRKGYKPRGKIWYARTISNILSSVSK